MNVIEMFELAKHRLHEQGGSFLVVLPKKWVQNNGLSKGDLVVIALDEKGALKLTPKQERG